MTRDRLRRRLEQQLEALRALEGRRSRWSAVWSYHLAGREILHFHTDRELDLRLTRRVIRAEGERLASDPRVEIGPRERDWVSVRFETASDLPFVLELVRLAVRANRR